MEVPKRLAPTTETIRQLFALSGNQCAFPNCRHVLINENGDFIAQICHIEGVRGQRFNAGMSNEQRRMAGNLVLLCYPHHKETDNEQVWNAGRLREMKRRHESAFAHPERAILRALTDWTTRDTLVLPRNLFGLYGPGQLFQEDHRVVHGEVVSYLKKFETVPVEVRSFLAKIIERADRAPQLVHSSNGAVSIPVQDACDAFRLRYQDVVRECNNLANHGLGCLDEDEQWNARVCVFAVSEYPFWSDLLVHSRLMGIPFSDYYQSLDFSSLSK